MKAARNSGGRRRAKFAACSRGFTLIEVMVVVAIMGLIAVAGIPTLYHLFQKEGMRKATSDLVEVLSKARAQAILRGEPVEVVFRSEDNSFTAQPAGGGGHLPDGVGFRHLVLNGTDYVAFPDTTVFSFNFYANGICDDVVIELLSDKLEQRRITLEILTGLADVEVIR